MGEARTNSHGQTIGNLVPDWSPPLLPAPEPMAGRHCRLETIDEELHGAQLFAQFAGDEAGWTYLPYGPFENREAHRVWLATAAASDDPQFFAVIVDGQAVGVASYLRIKPECGSIEVGHIHFSNALQRTPAATEAMYLMMRRAFELGYRRYEWKCDALNLPSRKAAERLGLSFEGVFRQAIVYKGRNRDTAWYAATDNEWPALKTVFEQWLAPENFGDNGAQRESLREMRGIDEEMIGR